MIFRAAWVLPISAPPVRHGWVEVEEGRIRAFGAADTEPSGPSGITGLGDVVVMPGLVNAHTHLELSYLRGAIAPAASFVAWVRQLLSLRRTMTDPRDPRILAAVAEGIVEASATGTALIGDISNSLVTLPLLAASALAAVVFHELLAFNVADAPALVDAAINQLKTLGGSEQVRLSLAAHAPYSVAPSLFGAIRAAMDCHLHVPCSVHLCESPEEVQFIASGEGPWRALLEEIGVWDSAWMPPSCSPVEYLDRLDFITKGTLVVHGVQMTDDDLAIVAGRGATLVTCPRSNKYVGVGHPPVERFYASGVPIALGTDSLASVPDLNMFSELAALRALAPSVPAAMLLASATRQGARALGFGGEYGEIAPGASGRLLAVELGADLGRAVDVEEYLLSGIAPGRLSWVGDSA